MVSLCSKAHARDAPCAEAALPLHTPCTPPAQTSGTGYCKQVIEVCPPGGLNTGMSKKQVEEKKQEHELLSAHQLPSPVQMPE